jgi:DNA-binding GntR family transcriptional regulator
MTSDAAIHFAPQFQHRNLPEQCADHIVLLIASGELQPGQRLFEKELCVRLGVSRVPVREAMRILQTQGVVRTEPNRGSFISEFGSVETAELLEIRLSVERLALKRLMDRMAAEPDLIAELDPQLQDMRRAAKLNEQLAYCQADLAFHNKLIELSQSPLLKPIWTSLSRGVLVFLMQERDVAFDYEGSIQEHVLLLDLIRSGREVAVDREIERHIMGYMHQRTRETSSKTIVQPRSVPARLRGD